MILIYSAVETSPPIPSTTVGADYFWRTRVAARKGANLSGSNSVTASVMRFAEDDRIAVSVSEACRLSGLGRTLLYAEMHNRRLKFILRRGRRLIRLDDLKAYLDHND